MQRLHLEQVNKTIEARKAKLFAKIGSKYPVKAQRAYIRCCIRAACQINGLDYNKMFGIVERLVIGTVNTDHPLVLLRAQHVCQVHLYANNFDFKDITLLRQKYFKDTNEDQVIREYADNYGRVMRLGSYAFGLPVNNPDDWSFLFPSLLDMSTSIDLLCANDPELTQKLYQACSLVGVESLDNRFKNKLKSGRARDNSSWYTKSKNKRLGVMHVSRVEFLVHFLVYLFMERIVKADLVYFSGAFRELINTELEIVRDNEDLAQKFSISCGRVSTVKDYFSNLDYSRKLHEHPYLVENAAFMPMSLNISVGNNGEKCSKIVASTSFHNQLIDSRVAISRFLLRNDSDKAVLSAVLDIARRPQC